MKTRVPVRVTVIDLAPIERGGVLALAGVEIEIAGVPVTLQGLRLRRGLDGRMMVELPMFDHPSGARFPAIGLCDDLARGVVAAVIEAWERRRKSAAAIGVIDGAPFPVA